MKTFNAVCLVALITFVCYSRATGDISHRHKECGYSTKACEGGTVTLSCSSAKIKVVSANYGRTDKYICDYRPTPVTDCRSSKSFDVVSSLCNGKSTCSVAASNGVFGDPCVGTRKYLDVFYECIEKHTEWELVFKAVSGVGGSVYDLWTGKDGRNQDKDQAKELNKDFSGHYKSDKVDSWANQRIKQVKVAVYEDGDEKMYMIFNAEGSDKNNWFSKSRLTATSYTDLNSGSTSNFFSIGGDTKWSRRFFVNKSYGGCQRDIGWLVVVDTASRVCGWMYLESRPYFLYGKAQKAIVYPYGHAVDVGRGDVFAIFIKN